MIKYKWRIVPRFLPAVLRNCPKCGGRSAYECSGNFRVNANQNHIDVWLIYLCHKCKTTWNMEILSRRDAKTIDREIYDKFLRNDPELAAQYAFDINTHIRNRTVPDYSSIPYDILGDNISLQGTMEASLQNSKIEASLHCALETVEIEILCNYPMDIRLDKLLSRKLKVSREFIKRLADENKISVEGSNAPCREKLKNGIRISILP